MKTFFCSPLSWFKMSVEKKIEKKISKISYPRHVHSKCSIKIKQKKNEEIPQ